MTVREESVLATLTKASFYDFLIEFWGTIIHDSPSFNWHIEYLCNELQEVAERVFKSEAKAYDLIVNIPPGSTKSTICSQMFPAWVWTRMPHAQFICASYAHAIALKDSVRTRDIVQSDLYQKCFPYIQLREDENTKGLFRNTQKGFRYSVGIGGAVTGYHGHFLIVDDPLNPEESYSEAELKISNRWMETTLPSRKMRYAEDVVPTILIQQRLHQADPSGEMLAKSKGIGIKHICLPAELTEHVKPVELKAKYVDGLLVPSRFPRSVLASEFRRMGAYGYACQYLQHPVPLGGNMFDVEKLKIVQDAPSPKRFTSIIRSWDKAGTEDGGAFSVGALVGIDDSGNTWILNIVRGQWGSTKRERKIKDVAKEDGFEIPILLEAEGGSGGKESAESTVRNLAGYRVTAYHPTGDKESRAYPLSSQVGAGSVYVLDRAWTKDFIEELRYFPHSKYKDQVDAASSGYNRIARKKRVVGGFSL